jgi:hypothetical protein
MTNVTAVADRAENKQGSANGTAFRQRKREPGAAGKVIGKKAFFLVVEL